MTCSLAQCHGYTVDGSFQRYAVSYARHCTPIPDGLPLEVAAPGESCPLYYNRRTVLTSARQSCALA